MFAIAAIVLGSPSASPASDKVELRNPSSLTERAPQIYRAKFETSKGSFVVEVHRGLAPLGADRFYNLVKHGFYDDCRFFRVIDGLVAQTGMSGDAAIQSAWTNAVIADDPRKESNRRGTVTFASAGPHSRSTQFFINLSENAKLFDRQGLAPLGQVISGLEVVDSLYSGYGEGAPRGFGPEQSRITVEGNAYLKKTFPKLDYVKKATIEK
ncbi:MAG TPA: peptidylprolyl isomerase [Vicinamibacterales bacterium]|nr:peptidylprolyl isomerase [Vicinamibacterales bacterium]